MKKSTAHELAECRVYLGLDSNQSLLEGLIMRDNAYKQQNEAMSREIMAHNEMNALLHKTGNHIKDKTHVEMVEVIINKSNKIMADNSRFKAVVTLLKEIFKETMMM